MISEILSCLEGGIGSWKSLMLTNLPKIGDVDNDVRNDSLAAWWS
jgi:hypothetical protein